MTQTQPWIIAHRGARNQAPENSGSALKHAVQLPVDGVEFDVQMSADGVPVLFHDRTLLKINGHRRRIRDFTFSELERIDWGGWFAPAFKGEPLTTLEAAFSILGNCPNICIEIKSHPADQTSGDAYRLTEKVIELLNRPDMRNCRKRALILSFDPEVLAVAHHRDDGLRYVLNLPAKAPLERLPETRYLWAVGTRISNMSERLVSWARRRSLRVFTYTCNGPRQVGKAIRTGADAIITDRPAWLIQYLAGT